MKAHDLATLLLIGPNYDVKVQSGGYLSEWESVREVQILDDSEEVWIESE